MLSWIGCFLLHVILHTIMTWEGSLASAQYKLKNASLELTFDYNSRFDKAWADNQGPFLLLVSSSIRVAIHLNSENELKMMQFHRDKKEFVGGYWIQLLSTKTCIKRQNSDLFCAQRSANSQENNSTHYYVGIRNKENIAVCFNGLTFVEPIYSDICLQTERLNLWCDPRRRGAVRNLVLETFLR